MTGLSVLKVLDLLENQGIDVWIDGGWGVRLPARARNP
jgi:hypothetical protein